MQTEEVQGEGAETPVDLDSLELDQLTSMVNDKSLTEEPTELVEPEGEDAESVEATEEDTEVEVEAAEDGDDTETEVEAEAEQSDEAETGDELSVEELRARVDELEHEAKHHESVAGRNAGEAGFHKQRVQQLEAQLRERLTQSNDYDEPTPQPQAPQQPADQSEQFRRIAASAMAVAAQQFAVQHPDMASVDEQGRITLTDELQTEVKAMPFDTASVVNSGDPQFAASQTSGLLTAAAERLKAKRAQAQRVEAEKSRVDQAKSLKKKKRAMAASSGTAGRSSPTKKPVAVDDLDVDQLKKLIDNQ